MMDERLEGAVKAIKTYADIAIHNLTGRVGQHRVNMAKENVHKIKNIVKMLELEGEQ